MFTKKISLNSIKGLRTINEDRFINGMIGDISIMGVFDGHGGIESVQLVADKIIPTFINCLKNNPILSEAISKTFHILDEKIHKFNYQDGTTACVALITGSTLLLAHVGDTKAVIIRDGKFIELTRDHKITDPEEMIFYRSSKWFKEKSRLISRGEIKGFKLMTVTRSLGDDFFEDAISSTPEINQLELKANDWLIIATDGLWNFACSDEVISCVVKIKDGENISETLIQLALKNKSTDNVTVGAVKI